MKTRFSTNIVKEVDKGTKMEGFADREGFLYCKSCVSNLQLDDTEQVLKSDYEQFATCDECQKDIFGREIEEDFIFVENSLIELFSLFQKYTSIMTDGHTRSCVCNFCTLSLELYSDGSGEVSIDYDEKSSFSFDSIANGIKEFQVILGKLEAQ